MPFVEITGPPLLQTAATGRLHYRRNGSGFPLVFLHGGWGYEVYPFDRQIEAFGERFEVLIPDRSGYGQGIEWPEKFAGIILEAFHYDRKKPRSWEFFEKRGIDPDTLSERNRTALARDQGPDDGRDVLKTSGGAWLEIARRAHLPEADLYRGRLDQLRVPTLFAHGSDDPRTEAHELERVARLLPDVPISFIPGGGHAPHAEREVWRELNRVVKPFLDRVLES